MVMAGLWKKKGRRRRGGQLLQEGPPPPEWDLQQGYPEYHDKYQACGRGYIPPSLSGKGGGLEIDEHHLLL